VADSYKQLQVWSKSIDLVDEYYDATENFPRDELFGLRSQIRRAAVSVASNKVDRMLSGLIASLGEKLEEADED
jgi:hypothetical protein